MCRIRPPRPLSQPSAAKSGVEMQTPKEIDDYPKIPGNPTVETMTPQDAQSKKGDCKCEDLQ